MPKQKRHHAAAYKAPDDWRERQLASQDAITELSRKDELIIRGLARQLATEIPNMGEAIALEVLASLGRRINEGMES